MTQAERSTGVVVFTPLAGEEPDDHAPVRTNSSADYFRIRERAERAAAKRAECSIARSVHQALAQHYAALARGGGA